MPAGGFQVFGAPHLVAVGLAVALPAAFTLIARRGSKAAARVIAGGWAGVLLGNDLIYWVLRIHQIGFEGWARNHLPLHVCGAAVLLTAATLLFRSPRTYEIVYFWGLVGSLNAVITPGNLEAGFPAYRFFHYFIAHSGIVVGVLFATWGLGMRPTLGGLFRAFAWLNGFAAVVGAVNLVLGSNYMFLSAPPMDTASPFFLAPWPWYLVFLEFLGLAMFFLVLSPFLATRWRRKRGGPIGASGGLPERQRRAKRCPAAG